MRQDAPPLRAKAWLPSPALGSPCSPRDHLGHPQLQEGGLLGGVAAAMGKVLCDLLATSVLAGSEPGRAGASDAGVSGDKAATW